MRQPTVQRSVRPLPPPCSMFVTRSVCAGVATKAKKPTTESAMIRPITAANMRQRPPKITAAISATPSATSPPRESVSRLHTRHSAPATTSRMRTIGLPFTSYASANAITTPATSTAEGGAHDRLPLPLARGRERDPPARHEHRGQGVGVAEGAGEAVGALDALRVRGRDQPVQRRQQRREDERAQQPLDVLARAD